MKVELLKAISIQSVSRTNVGETDNTIIKSTALQSSTLSTTLGDNKLMSGGVAGGTAGYMGGEGTTVNKQNYTFGIIQNNIKT